MWSVQRHKLHVEKYPAELSASLSEAASLKWRQSSSIQGTTSPLLKAEVLYRAFQSPQLFLIVSQLNPLHILTSYFCNIHFHTVLPSTPRCLRLSLLSRQTIRLLYFTASTRRQSPFRLRTKHFDSQTGSEGQPSSNSMGTDSFFISGGKVAEVWSWPFIPMLCQGEEWVELYFHSYILLCHAQGQPYYGQVFQSCFD
jgi:hypothetical protein